MTVPDAPALSPRVEAVVRPVRDAIRATRAELEALPPPTSDSERLIRLARLDQAAREALYGLELSGLGAGERRIALAVAWSRVEAVDQDNQRALKAMLPADSGWFTRSAVGDKAAEAAWLVAIHAVRDRALMRQALRRMEPLVGTDEIDGEWYGALYDRLAVLERRLQRYGMQPVCRNGEWTAGEIEDPARLEARRATLGPGLRMLGGDVREPPGCR